MDRTVVECFAAASGGILTGQHVVKVGDAASHACQPATVCQLLKLQSRTHGTSAAGSRLSVMTEASPEPGVPGAESMFTVDRGQSRAVEVTSASQVIGLVPYLLGFHPEDSLVVLVLTGPQGSSLKSTLRVSLGKPDDPDAGVWPVAAVVTTGSGSPVR